MNWLTVSTRDENIPPTHFNSMQSSMPMMATLNRDGIYVSVNNSWSKQLGIMSDNLLQHYCKDFLHSYDVDRVDRWLDSIRSGVATSPLQLHHETRCVEQSEINRDLIEYKSFYWHGTVDLYQETILICAFSIPDATSIAASGTHDDVADSKTSVPTSSVASRTTPTETTLASSVYPSTWMNKLAAGIAHEIRNPLTSVNGFLKLMERDIGEHPYWSIIKSELGEIEEFIDDLLMLTHAEESQSERKPIDLKLMLAELITELEKKLETFPAYRFDNKVEALSQDQPSLAISNVTLQQLLKQLLRNGMQAMPRGGTITIHTEWGFMDGKPPVKISIHDESQGSSIQTPVNASLFEANDSFNFGLMISSQIVEIHEGSLDIERIPGHGTTVIATLPAQ